MVARTTLYVGPKYELSLEGCLSRKEIHALNLEEEREECRDWMAELLVQSLRRQYHALQHHFTSEPEAASHKEQVAELQAPSRDEHCYDNLAPGPSLAAPIPQAQVQK